MKEEYLVFVIKTFEVKINIKIEQKFCKDQCRNDFHSYGRKYVRCSQKQDKLITTIKQEVDKTVKTLTLLSLMKYH